MKVLYVISGNAGYISPFVLDQANAINQEGIETNFFMLKGKGVLVYFSNYQNLKDEIKLSKPDLIHAHYGLSGLLSVLQRRIPVITTFHGSDINMFKVRFLSRLADLLSAKSIFVSYKLAKKLNKKKPIVIPCGVDMHIFFSKDKILAKRKMSMSSKKKYILFSSSFDSAVKNYPLAKEAVSKLNIKDVELIELKGYNRDEVSWLMNAVDLVLLTSYSEGSPQFIKEAMACNTQIVSVNVGDVEDIISETDGCYIAKYDATDLASKISLALSYGQKTNGRSRIGPFDNHVISKKIIELYKSISNTV